jgi:predicted nucleic acid-binding protein
VSKLVLIEAEKNILTKLASDVWTRYEEQILTLPLVTAPIATNTELLRTKPIAGEKDAHVLAAAIAVGAPFLITHDQRLARRVNQAALSVRGMSPGEFIQTVLKHHPDYRLIREQTRTDSEP